MSKQRGTTVVVRLSNDKIRARYMAGSFGSKAAVDADRSVREALCDAAVLVNESMTECDHKHQALASLELAMMYVKQGLRLHGVLAPEGDAT